METETYPINVWFVCKLCADSFQSIGHFFNHKKEKHFPDFQNAKCIVFEEKTCTFDYSTDFVNEYPPPYFTLEQGQEAEFRSKSPRRNDDNETVETVSPTNCILKYDFLDLLQPPIQPGHQLLSTNGSVIQSNFECDYFDHHFINGNEYRDITEITENANINAGQSRQPSVIIMREDSNNNEVIQKRVIEEIDLTETDVLEGEQQKHESQQSEFDLNLESDHNYNSISSTSSHLFQHPSFPVTHTLVTLEELQRIQEDSQDSSTTIVDVNQNFNEGEDMKEYCELKHELTEDSSVNVIPLESASHSQCYSLLAQSESSDELIIDEEQEPENPLQCKTCRKIISSEALLKIHVVICAMYRNSNPNFGLSEPQPDSSRDKRIIDFDNKSKLKCQLCSDEFETKVLFNRHLEAQHREEKPFNCIMPNCSKSFTKRRYLNSHLRAHSFKSPCRCNGSENDCQCGKISPKRSRSHQFYPRQNHGINEDAPKHVCEICHKNFKYKSFYITHLLVHTADRPFKCSIEGCRAAFKRKFDFQKHQRRHRLNDPGSPS